MREFRNSYVYFLQKVGKVMRIKYLQYIYNNYIFCFVSSNRVGKVERVSSYILTYICICLLAEYSSWIVSIITLLYLTLGHVTVSFNITSTFTSTYNRVVHILLLSYIVLEREIISSDQCSALIDAISTDL